jgi:hypothetical protein
VLASNPDVLKLVVDQHRDDLLREAAAERLAATLPKKSHRDHTFPPVVAPLNLLVALARQPGKEPAYR